MLIKKLQLSLALPGRIVGTSLRLTKISKHIISTLFVFRTQVTENEVNFPIAVSLLDLV